MCTSSAKCFANGLLGCSFKMSESHCRNDSCKSGATALFKTITLIFILITNVKLSTSVWFQWFESYRFKFQSVCKVLRNAVAPIQFITIWGREGQLNDRGTRGKALIRPKRRSQGSRCDVRRGCAFHIAGSYPRNFFSKFNT